MCLLLLLLLVDGVGDNNGELLPDGDDIGELDNDGDDEEEEEEEDEEDDDDEEDDGNDNCSSSLIGVSIDSDLIVISVEIV